MKHRHQKFLYVEAELNISVMTMVAPINDRDGGRSVQLHPSIRGFVRLHVAVKLVNNAYTSIDVAKLRMPFDFGEVA